MTHELQALAPDAALVPRRPVGEPGVLEELLGAAGLRPSAAGDVAVPYAPPDRRTLERGMFAAGNLRHVVLHLGPERAAAALADAAAPFRRADGSYLFHSTFRWVVADVTSVGEVADWDGRGLPPVAAERVRRAAEGGAWTSLLSAPAAAGLEVAGFDPVGEVMGSMVQRIGWSSYYGCGSGAGARTADDHLGLRTRARGSRLTPTRWRAAGPPPSGEWSPRRRASGPTASSASAFAAEPGQRGRTSSRPWARRPRPFGDPSGPGVLHAPGGPGRRQAGPRGLDARRAGARHRGRDPPRRLEHPPAAHLDRGQHRGRRVHRAGQPRRGPTPACSCSTASARWAPTARSSPRWACPPGRSSRRRPHRPRRRGHDLRHGDHAVPPLDRGADAVPDLPAPEEEPDRDRRPHPAGHPRGRDAPPRRDAARPGDEPVHLGPLGERVPARARGRVPAAGARARVEHLPRRLPVRPVEQEPGARHALAGHVPRARAGDDAHGGRGRPARRRRHRRGAAGHRVQGVRVRSGRVHRGRHGRQGRPPARPRGVRGATTATSRSPPTCPARTSGRSSRRATRRSAWSWARASTTSPISGSGRR